MIDEKSQRFNNVRGVRQFLLLLYWIGCRETSYYRFQTNRNQQHFNNVVQREENIQNLSNYIILLTVR